MRTIVQTEQLPSGQRQISTNLLKNRLNGTVRNYTPKPTTNGEFVGSGVKPVGVALIMIAGLGLTFLFAPSAHDFIDSPRLEKLTTNFFRQFDEATSRAGSFWSIVENWTKTEKPTISKKSESSLSKAPEITESPNVVPEPSSVESKKIDKPHEDTLPASNVHLVQSESHSSPSHMPIDSSTLPTSEPSIETTQTNPTAELNDSSPKPTAELNDSPSKPTAELNDSPSKPTAELNDSPSKPTAELNDSPSKPTAELNDSPSKPTAELNDSPSKPTAELNDSPSNPTAELNDSPPKPTAELNDSPSKPTAELNDSSSKPTAELNDSTSQTSHDRPELSHLDSVVLAMDELKSMEAWTEQMLQEALSTDVDSLDKEALSVRLRSVASLLKESGKWRATRLLHYISMIKAEVGQRYSELMSSERSKLELDLHKQLLERDLEVISGMQTRLRQALFDMETTHQQDITRLGRNAEEHLNRTVSSRESELRKEFNLKFKQEAIVTEKNLTSILEKEAIEFSDLNHRFRVIVDLFKNVSSRDEQGLRIRKISAACLNLTVKLSNRDKINQELKALIASGAGDDLVSSVVGALPLDAQIPTIFDLQSRFHNVKAQCRRAMMVPVGLNGLLGQVIGDVLAFITIPPMGLIHGTGVEESLSRAEYYLSKGDLASTLNEVVSVKGYEAAVLKDWMEDAKLRLQVDQAMQVLNSHVSLMNFGFTEE